MGVLGKVTGDLDAPRGPDVTHKIAVPASWFGREISVTLPRNVHCAACSGGGCDRCERSGAISLRGRKDEARPLSIRLPEAPGDDRSLCLRIPEEGGSALEEGLGKGHLLLTVGAGVEPSPGVVLSSMPSRQTEEERRELLKRSLIMAAVLILLFLGMLKLSGWL